ncbi:AAA family ATPase [Tardiphaga sp. 862_B3_N1_1]|uniref:AAA family ATPase n=1 Tax=Tardiphaga sp. 862_B3_N1_1 TaxID=3240763 RepID=UPI003F8B690E
MTNFANLYRPTQFEEVVGQRQAVKILSGLALRRKTRSILLSGSFGSGKTSMARILAKAWNCEMPSALGSPCGACRYCRNEGNSPIVECVVTTMNGDAEEICRILHNWNRPSPDFPVRTIFFDEAHGLKESGADALLQATEEPVEGVCILFATTKPWRLQRALLSRLTDVKVTSLSQVDSVILLRRIAAKAKLTCETDALVLLASLKRGHPRDLISGLEQVSYSGGHITADLVKQCFEIDQEDYLIKYFLALSQGNADAQHKIMQEWREPLTSKIEWLRAYLLSLYHRDVLLQDVTIDPVIDSMTRSRGEIIQGFCERLQIGTAKRLEPFWRQLLDFWLRPDASQEAVLRLRLTLFESIVNRGRVHDALPRNDVAVASPRPPRVAARLLPNVVASEPSSSSSDVSGGHHFGGAEMALIINRLSDFAQHYGRFANAMFEIIPSYIDMQDDELAMDLIARFADDLDDYIGSKEEIGAVVTVFDTTATGVVGKAIAVVPDLMGNEGNLADLEAWCDRWAYNGGSGHRIEPQCTLRHNDHRFHWTAMRRLAARIHDAPERQNFELVDHEPLSVSEYIMKELRVRPDKAYIGPLARPRVIFSHSLSEAFLERLCALDMPFLSALDDGAPGWLTEGWEIDEHRERRAEQSARRKAVRETHETYDEDEERTTALAALQREWPKQAKERRRKSTNWWWSANEQSYS